LRVGALAVLVAVLAAAPSRAAFDPQLEARNYSKIFERQAIYMTPQYQSLLNDVSQRNFEAAVTAQLNDPERSFTTDLCWNYGQGCAGDARLYDWQTKGYGIVQPVLFTARNGATLTGHIWATRSGPPQRPGVVITNGSVQAPETLYWFVAQALAKAGYVVMTWDPQGQGQSDTRGESPDQDEGFPAQSDGRPFFDGTEDALNFFYSTPQHVYVPESSCSSGTSHAAKQARRVKAGLDAAYNPFWSLFDHQRVGLAGHSYGAAGVSYIGQWDPRVDAIVAWDNLSQPAPGTAGSRSFPPGEGPCPAHPEDRTDLTKNAAFGRGKPALGMSADYFLPPEPNTSEPRTPQQCQQVQDNYDQHGQKPSMQEGLDCKAFMSHEYSRFGLDTGEIVIRGGSHLDFSFIPTPGPEFGATLRGADLIGWYTTAWFDRYVKGDPSADARLLTDRWRHDGEEGAVDPDHDANMFSFYHQSRLDFHKADGTQVDCEDLRAGCPALAGDDGYPGEYGYLAVDASPDGAAAPGAPHGSGLYAAPSARRACASRRTIVVHLRRVHGASLRRVVARVGRRVVGRSRGQRVVVRLRGLPRGRFNVRLALTLRSGGRTRHVTLTRRYRTCA
jgi:dienelactone hydrolase